MINIINNIPFFGFSILRELNDADVFRTIFELFIFDLNLHMFLIKKLTLLLNSHLASLGMRRERESENDFKQRR